MIILAVTAVLVTFVVTHFGNANAQFGRQNISRKLKVNLERARFDSVKRRPTLANGSDNAEMKILNASSFSVKIGMNQDGALVYPVTITFNRYGCIEAKDNSATPKDITPLFTVCGGECTTDVQTSQPQLQPMPSYKFPVQQTAPVPSQAADSEAS